MTFRNTYEIPEKSAFFQGHTGQFFSKGTLSFDTLSFRVKTLRPDENKLEDFNLPRLAPQFVRIMNNYIRLRNSEGAEIPLISVDTLKLKAIRLIDSDGADGNCGEYQIYPRNALCTYEGCNQYFDIYEGKKCGHRNDRDFKQIRFLTFCDDCGWLLPWHYMTNIYNDCKKCKEKKSLRKLLWRNPDEPGTYKVQCIKCGQITGLYYYKCRHYDKSHDEIRSKKQPHVKFRPVSARAGTIVHPKVISLPEITPEGKSGISKASYRSARALSEAFFEFFRGRNETLLYTTEFRMEILNDNQFWLADKVLDLCNEFQLDTNNRYSWAEADVLKVIGAVLVQAHQRINYSGLDSNRIKDLYSIDRIDAALHSVKNAELEEKDLQGFYLLTLGRSEEVSSNACLPQSPPSEYTTWLDNFGLRKIEHKPNLKIIQALLGIIEGSTMREPILFRPILSGKTKDPTVFLREFFTEGILFQLDYGRMVRWILANEDLNGKGITANLEQGDEATYNSLLQDANCRHALEVLLHTYSHMIMQQSTIHTGLDIQSLSEMIFPKIGSVFIYSTDSINIGGLEFTYDYHLEEWFERIKELVTDCPQDPACLIDEGGSCNACSYLPEFVCERFNLDLDRSALIGGGNYTVGYL